MSIVTNRQQRRQLERDNRVLPVYLREIARDGWPESAANSDLRRVWRSRYFLVQEFVAPSPAIVRLSVNRTTLAGERWAENITWDELQAIKNEIGYFAHAAVEVYPPVQDVVNVANMRHLWILSDVPPFAWKRSLTINPV